MGAVIDEEQDFAPILDTTCYFDEKDSNAQKEPLKHTMGILRSTEVEDGEKNRKMTPVITYSVLYPILTGKDERASLFDIWAKISTKSLLSLVGRMGSEENVSERSLKNLTGHVVVNSVIEMDWRSIADDLGYGSMILQ